MVRVVGGKLAFGFQPPKDLPFTMRSRKGFGFLPLLPLCRSPGSSGAAGPTVADDVIIIIIYI